MPQMSSLWWSCLMLFFWISWTMFTIFLGFWWRATVVTQTVFFFFFFYYNLSDILLLVMNFSTIDGSLVFKFCI